MNKNLLIMAILLFTLFSFSCTHSGDQSKKKARDLYTLSEDCCLYIEESGVYTPYLVIDSNYNGDVLLLRKEPLAAPMAFNSYSSQYEDSDIDHYLNTEFITCLYDKNLDILDSEIVITSNESIGIAGQETSHITRKVFLLSYTELGFDDSVNTAHEGKPLKFFQEKERRLAYISGQSVNWWLRTPNTYFDSCVYYIGQNNTVEIANAYDENRIRPAFCISRDAQIEEHNDILDGKTVYTLSD